MADKDILTLLPADALDGTEWLHIVQDGASVKVQLSTLAAWIKLTESIVPEGNPVFGVELTPYGAYGTVATNTLMLWQPPVFDVGGWYNIGASTRLTVPAGVTKIDLSAQIRVTAAGTTAGALRLLKNGATYALQTFQASGTEHGASIALSNVAVVPGDYFEMQYEGASGRTIQSGGTFLSARAVEMTP